MPHRPRILLVTPARESDNNGNYHTARRWREFLSERYEVTVVQQFSGEESDLLIALHARRSANAIRAFRARNPNAPIILALTGTDLYKDLPQQNADAIASMRAASSWIMLQEHAPLFLSGLPVRLLVQGDGRDIQVVFQSAPELPALPKRTSLILNIAFVGHLRDEKDPRTLFNAIRSLPKNIPIAVNAVGNGLDADLAREASQLAAEDARFAWLGGLSHEKTREIIRQADVLVVPSKMEGGANVIVEALTSGTPVLASSISGNIGMLGSDWPGLFKLGDASQLAALFTRCLSDLEFFKQLIAATERRAPYFHPAMEAAALLSAVESELH
jgi:putative glycosyltransferase (TIGR04348 family)